MKFYLLNQLKPFLQALLDIHVSYLSPNLQNTLFLFLAVVLADRLPHAILCNARNWSAKLQVHQANE